MTIRPQGSWHFDTLSATTFNAPSNAITSNSQIGDNTGITRAKMGQEALSEFPLLLRDARTWNALYTNLPTGAGTNDDFGYTHGDYTAGTMPILITKDQKNNLGADSVYAAWEWYLPLEYDAAETVTIRVKCKTSTIASTTSTIDCSVYSDDRDATGSADLVTTAAQDANSATYTDYDFVVTATDLDPGQRLIVLIKNTINDTGTGTAVQCSVCDVRVKCDTRG